MDIVERSGSATSQMREVQLICQESLERFRISTRSKEQAPITSRKDDHLYRVGARLVCERLCTPR